MHYHYDIVGDDFSRAGGASAEMKKTLQRLGISHEVIKRTAVAMYEAEINMVVHAGGGEADIDIEREAITIVMRDHGPGIANIDLAMQDGWSTAPELVRELGFGAGMGLPNMKRAADSLSIEPAPDGGTVVTMTINIGEKP